MWLYSSKHSVNQSRITICHSEPAEESPISPVNVRLLRQAQHRLFGKLRMTERPVYRMFTMHPDECRGVRSSVGLSVKMPEDT